MPINWSTSTSTADVNLSAVSVQQFSNITPVDFSASVPAGSRAYSIDMPEGLEVMSKALRVIGAPVNTQAETTANIYIVPPSGSPFWCRLPITVTTPAGAVYDNGGAGYTDNSFITSLSEFGTGYTGPGCTVLLAAGANITITGVTGGLNNRFQGLSSQVIIKSIDPSNPATIDIWTMANSDGDPYGNVALVDLKVEGVMSGSIWPGSGALPTQSLVSFASVDASNISIIRCAFKGDVLPADQKPDIRSELYAIRGGGDRVTVWNCSFRRLFNGVLNNGSNTLVGRCTMEECWGDLWRLGPHSSNDNNYVMGCDNWMGQCTADGATRHADLIQVGGSGGVGTGAALNYMELRGNISSDGTLEEMPAVNGSTSRVVASTNQTASLTDDVFYRMETDVAAGNLTVQLPATSSVATGWTAYVQKYSADTTYTVTVLRDGADTINGVAADFVISGKWKAYRFTRSGSNWTIELFGRGLQNGLYQTVGSLTAGMNNSLIWACGSVSSQLAGHSFEIATNDVDVDYCTLVRTLAGDTDGDGVEDRNDYLGPINFPAIQLRNNSATDLVFSNSAAAAIAKDAGITANFTGTNNDTTQNTEAAVQARFVGGGALNSTRLDAIRGMRHVEGGPLDGTGIGAVWKGVADGPYDFINMRVRLPGAPTVTTAPIIAGSDAAGFTISTAAVFSASLPTTHQWLRDGVPIPGATGTTYAGDAGAASGSKVSLRVTGASALGDAIADSVNEITKP